MRKREGGGKRREGGRGGGGNREGGTVEGRKREREGRVGDMDKRRQIKKYGGAQREETERKRNS